MTELENKLAAKEEELKNSEIELVAKNERFERVGLLKGELARLHADNMSLKDQLGEAKAAAANAISEYQSLAEMAVLNQTIWDEAYEEATESFGYTTVTQHSDWDLAYLGNHLATQITEWYAELQANQLLAEERPARPPSLAAEP